MHYYKVSDATLGNPLDRLIVVLVLYVYLADPSILPTVYCLHHAILIDFFKILS